MGPELLQEETGIPRENLQCLFMQIYEKHLSILWFYFTNSIPVCADPPHRHRKSPTREKEGIWLRIILWVILIYHWLPTLGSRIPAAVQVELMI